jgi:hypothetical protein
MKFSALLTFVTLACTTLSVPLRKRIPPNLREFTTHMICVEENGNTEKTVCYSTSSYGTYRNAYIGEY